MITEKEIKTTNFKDYSFEREQTSFRMSKEDLSGWNTDDVELSDMISKKAAAYAKENGISNKYEGISYLCQMSPKTLKNAISGRTNVIQREFLYKFTVGLKMKKEEANEFFRHCGGELHEDCLEDKICLNALRDGDSALSFIEEYNKYSRKKPLNKLDDISED